MKKNIASYKIGVELNKTDDKWENNGKDLPFCGVLLNRKEKISFLHFYLLKFALTIGFMK